MSDVCVISEFPVEYRPDYLLSNRALGAAYIAAVLRKKGYKVDFINPVLFNVSMEQCLERIKEQRYRYVLLSVSFNFVTTYELIKKIVSEDIDVTIIIGGIYVTNYFEGMYLHNKCMENVIASIGEGEETISELLYKLDNGLDWRDTSGIIYYDKGRILVNERRARITNLDAIPFPTQDEIPFCVDKGLPVSMFTSRGCPGTCLYCGSGALLNDKKNTWYGRSAENVFAELKEIYDRYNAKTFSFVDDNFLGDYTLGNARCIKICQYIIENGLNINFFMECRPDNINQEVAMYLKKAGCGAVFLGIESASDVQLKKIGRGKATSKKCIEAIEILNGLEIETMIGFIMFTPDATMSDIEANLDFLENFFSKRYVGEYKTQAVNLALFSQLMLIPNTIITKKMEKEGRIISSNFDYLIADASVQLLLDIMKKHQLNVFLEQIENDIRHSWYDVIDGSKNKCIVYIKEYENQLMLHSIKLFRKVIEQIKTGDITNVSSIIHDYKKNLVIFKREQIRRIKKILKEG